MNMKKEKGFVPETFTFCEFYSCSLNVLYTNSVFKAVALTKFMNKAIGPWLSSLPRYKKFLWWL